MDRLPYKSHREALDGIARNDVPPNRKFIIGICKWGDTTKPQCSATGGNTRYFQDITILERIFKRRPHMVSLVVYQRLDVAAKVGKNGVIDATIRT